MTLRTGDVHVGRVRIPLGTASAWVRDYTNAAINVVSARPYAFPAYDHYDRGTNEPDRLTDGDLLAPGLLNVPVKIRSFYGLQRVRGQLEEALRHPVLEKPLADIADPEETDRPCAHCTESWTTRPRARGALAGRPCLRCSTASDLTPLCFTTGGCAPATSVTAPRFLEQTTAPGRTTWFSSPMPSGRT